MTVRMIMVGMTMVMVLVAVTMMLVIVRRRHCGADRVQRTAHAARGIHKAPALDPDQPRADQRDQPVTDDLDHPFGVAKLSCGGIEHNAGDADDCDRNERLQQRRGERQHDAAPPGLVVGNDVRRDHRLAVARTGRMEDAVEELSLIHI